MFPNRPSSFKIQATEDVHRLNGRPGGAQTKQEKAVYNKLEPGPESSSVRLEICCESRLTFEEGESKKSVIDVAFN